MAMFRRSRRSTSPLRHKQQQIARREAELRERLEQLERMVTRGTTAQNESSARGEEQGARRNKTDKRFQVSVAFEPVFFFQAEDGIRDLTVTGVQTCALPI